MWPYRASLISSMTPSLGASSALGQKGRAAAWWAIFLAACFTSSPTCEACWPGAGGCTPHAAASVPIHAPPTPSSSANIPPQLGRGLQRVKCLMVHCSGARQHPAAVATAMFRCTFGKMAVSTTLSELAAAEAHHARMRQMRDACQFCSQRSVVG